MPIVTRVNLPIGTSNHIFLNREGLERLKKVCPRGSQSMMKLTIFKTQEEDVQIVWDHLKPKKKQHWKRLHPKKKSSEGLRR